LKFGLTVTSYP